MRGVCHTLHVHLRRASHKLRDVRYSTPTVTAAKIRIEALILGGLLILGQKVCMYKNGGFCSSEARSNGCRLILVRLQRLVEDSLQSHACVALQ